MEAKITKTHVQAYTVPTDAPEADGTFAWHETTLILVELEAGGQRSLGYTYANTATAKYIGSLLAEQIAGKDAMQHGALLGALRAAIRNMGETGVSAMAVAAIDNSLWDLRARLLNVPLVQLIGQVRPGIAVYGSGGFTSYSDAQLTAQLGGWARDGFTMVKMKVGSQPERDPHRVEVARKAIGPEVQLFTDANGAYSVKQALELIEIFRSKGVTWMEEPVSSDNLAGLHQIRSVAPPGLNIAAGEYGYTAWYFERMITAGAVDVQQADATRCQGSADFWKWQRYAGRTTCRFPRTAGLASTSMSAAQCREPCTWSSFTTTPASSACSSTASANRARASCIRIFPVPASVSNSSGAKPKNMR